MGFRPPFDAASRERLALYCRYMRCPTAKQWTDLLAHYGQKEFFTAGEPVPPNPAP